MVSIGTVSDSEDENHPDHPGAPLFVDKPPNYGDTRGYWEHRFQVERQDKGREYTHDWYLTPERTIRFLESYFEEPRGQRILVLGCGNSSLPAALYARGYRSVLGVDLSARVIVHMQEMNRGKEGLEFAVADARRLSAVPDGHYDYCVDVGLMDTLACGFEPETDLLAMHKEAARVLRGGGVYLALSHGSPLTRLPFLRCAALPWDAAAIALPTPECPGLHLYACTTRTDAAAVAAAADDPDGRAAAAAAVHDENERQSREQLAALLHALRRGGAAGRHTRDGAGGDAGGPAGRVSAWAPANPIAFAAPPPTPAAEAAAEAAAAEADAPLVVVDTVAEAAAARLRSSAYELDLVLARTGATLRSGTPGAAAAELAAAAAAAVAGGGDSGGGSGVGSRAGTAGLGATSRAGSALGGSRGGTAGGGGGTRKAVSRSGAGAAAAPFGATLDATPAGSRGGTAGGGGGLSSTQGAAAGSSRLSATTSWRTASWRVASASAAAAARTATPEVAGGTLRGSLGGGRGGAGAAATVELGDTGLGMAPVVAVGAEGWDEGWELDDDGGGGDIHESDDDDERALTQLRALSHELDPFS